jgi:hypothetical protein
MKLINEYYSIGIKLKLEVVIIFHKGEFYKTNIL